MRMFTIPVFLRTFTLTLQQWHFIVTPPVARRQITRQSLHKIFCKEEIKNHEPKIKNQRTTGKKHTNTIFTQKLWQDVHFDASPMLWQWQSFIQLSKWWLQVTKLVGGHSRPVQVSPNCYVYRGGHFLPMLAKQWCDHHIRLGEAVMWPSH
jgi:hypothetical protein